MLKDPEIKKTVQVYYKKAFDEVVGPRYASSAPPPGVDPGNATSGSIAAVEYLTDHYPRGAGVDRRLHRGGHGNAGRSAGSSIYPAVQNMLLAARALGLGSTLTTRHMLTRRRSRRRWASPPGVHSYAILPIGYPMGRFGPVGRGSLADVVYQDGWGKPYPGI